MWATSRWRTCRCRCCADTWLSSPKSTTSSSEPSARIWPSPSPKRPTTKSSSPRRRRCTRVGRSPARRHSHGTRTTGYQVSPAQAQQVALARLVLSNPHTSSWTRPRPCWIRARPTSRTFIGRRSAWANGRRDRAPTAHGPRCRPGLRRHRRHDRRVGYHDELVALNGEYASLWSSCGMRSPARRRISRAW